MATPSFALFKLTDQLIRTDVQYMSLYLLGVPYSALQNLIYPHPPYNIFIIKKRNGTPRIIHEPRKKLKDLQYKVLGYLYRHAGPVKPCVHGFTEGCSIVTNAKKHCSPKTQHLLNIDIKDFFPSITFYRVRGLLQKKPFEFSYEVATVLAHLCTFNNMLPQGAPTSPLLANLTCRSLDRDLMKLAKRHRAIYTRYADDITFSFSDRHSIKLPANICSFNSGILTLGDEIQAIFSSHSFQINSNKSRLSTRSHRLEVTGVTINEFPNVKRAFIDRIRGALNAWKKHGYELAQTRWEQNVNDGISKVYEKQPWNRQTRSGRVPDLKNVLRGKLLYVRMVRGGDDPLYIRMAKLYNNLCAQKKAADDEFAYSSLPVDSIVRTEANAKDAVFVIEWSGDYKIPGNPETTEMVGAQGTAFAYKNVGLITCDHVLSYSEEINGKPENTDFYSPDVINKTLIVTNPATGQHWPAKVIHRNKQHDLAIIRFDLPDPPEHHHFVGMDKPIETKARGILIGCPNHLAGKEADFLKGEVLNCYPRSTLNRFDIDCNIRQGNSGGPFVDEHFRVAGVAQQGATQNAGNNQCLCITHLDEWLAKGIP